MEPHKYTAADGSIRRGYNPKKVFDIADVNVPESEYPKAQSYEQKTLLEALVHDSPVPIRRTEKSIVDSLAVYDPEQKAVFLRAVWALIRYSRCLPKPYPMRRWRWRQSDTR